MSQYGFYFDQTRCTGCFTCAVACKDWHDLPAGSANWLRVQSIEKGTFPHPFVAYLFTPCYHCEKPACVDICPADALVKNPENGIVTVNPVNAWAGIPAAPAKRPALTALLNSRVTGRPKSRNATSAWNVSGKAKNRSAWRPARSGRSTPARWMNCGKNTGTKKKPRASNYPSH